MRVLNLKMCEFEGTHESDFWERMLVAIMCDSAEKFHREIDERDAALTPPARDEGGTR